MKKLTRSRPGWPSLRSAISIRARPIEMSKWPASSKTVQCFRVGSSGTSFVLLVHSSSLRPRKASSSWRSSASSTSVACRYESAIAFSSVVAVTIVAMCFPPLIRLAKRSPGHEVPAAVNREIDAVHRRVGQQKDRRVDNVAHRRQPASRRLGSDAFQDLRGLRAPVWAVADDPGMDGIDPDWRQLHHQGSDQTLDAGVHRGHDRRPAVGFVLRATAKNEDGTIRFEPGVEGVDDLGIADEFEGDEPERAADVVFADLVLIAFDRRQHQMMQRTDVLEGRRDLRRLRQVEAQAAASVTDLARRRRGTLWIAAGDDDLVVLPGKMLCQLQTQSVGSPDDEDGTARHQPLVPMWLRRYSQSRANRYE